MELIEISSTTSLVKGLLQDLRKNINFLIEGFDVESFEKIVSISRKCQGALIFTGVGKSGAIAKKIASTLSGCGKKALYLSSQDGLHGDIGIVDEGDVVFLLSKSGETDELLELCPALKNKGAYLVAVVMNDSSRLVHICDSAFILPVLKELCPYDLSPTTSAVAQLIFGDLLAMALMRLNAISLSEFVQNHPAGRIGKRHILRVKDLMVRDEALPICFEDDCLSDVLVELSNKRCGCICVVGEEKELLGIFTDGDLRRALQREGGTVVHQSMKALMTKNPRAVGPDVLAFDAMKLMEEKSPVTSLVVVTQGRCVGLIRMHDILQAGI